MKLRKGMKFKRKSDGFVFEVKSTGHQGRGGLFQCVDAEKIFGWYWVSDVEFNFEKVP